MDPACPVLVVDDDADVRTVVAAILTEAGIVILSAGSGCEALAILRASCIALLLTDIVMPGMNGIELAEAAHAIQPRMQIIFMTGYARQLPLQDRCVLRKPFRARELVSVVAHALQVPRCNRVWCGPA
jgi:CheY-like chemotaxis protein